MIEVKPEFQERTKEKTNQALQKELYELACQRYEDCKNEPFFQKILEKALENPRELYVAAYLQAFFDEERARQEEEKKSGGALITSNSTEPINFSIFYKDGKILLFVEDRPEKGGGKS